MKSVAFCTLGCKVNQYETQAMRELFMKKGYIEVDFDKKADVYVINTCSVTSMSDRKSRQMIRRAKRSAPESIVVVTGCYAQTASREVEKIEGVNLIIGTSGRDKIVELVEKADAERTENVVGDIMNTHTFEKLSVDSYTDKTRAYIKVQEGCGQFCSYCIIPYARGPVRSRSEESVVEEAKRLAGKGYLEIVLVGIHIASYGKDTDEGSSLERLICRLAEIDDIKRIRLSSIEPMTLGDSFIEAVSMAKEKLCHHFHISLQSGCDETLVRMNRKYLTKDFEKIVMGLRKASPDAAITTDIMVGFPGETDEEFEKSLYFAKKIGFADMHVFAYSQRPGTPAAIMENQISADVKHIRSNRMLEVAKQNRDKFLDGFIGREMMVLFEQKCGKNAYEGKTENYITVMCESESELSGEMLLVRLISHKDGIMSAVIAQ